MKDKLSIDAADLFAVFLLIVVHSQYRDFESGVKVKTHLTGFVSVLNSLRRQKIPRLSLMDNDGPFSTLLSLAHDIILELTRYVMVTNDSVLQFCSEVGPVKYSHRKRYQAEFVRNISQYSPETITIWQNCTILRRLFRSTVHEDTSGQKRSSIVAKIASEVDKDITSLPMSEYVTGQRLFFLQRPTRGGEELESVEEASFWIAVYDYSKLLLLLIQAATVTQGLETESARELGCSLVSRIEDHWASGAWPPKEILHFRQPLSVRILTFSCLVFTMHTRKNWGTRYSFTAVNY